MTLTEIIQSVKEFACDVIDIARSKEGIATLAAIATLGLGYTGIKLYNQSEEVKLQERIEKIHQDSEAYWKANGPNGREPTDEECEQMKQEIYNINQEIYRKANPDLFPTHENQRRIQQKQNTPSKSLRGMEELYAKVSKLPNTRGIRNKNPGNIKTNGMNWAGQIGDDGTFCTFISHEYGLRAIAKNIKDQEKLYGRDTIREIIKSWAPKSDKNNTHQYIQFVSDKTGYHPDQKLDLTNKETMVGLVAAISKRDSGASYTKATYEKAIAMLPRKYQPRN